VLELHIDQFQCNLLALPIELRINAKAIQDRNYVGLLIVDSLCHRLRREEN
jgi:hypothetical protein